MLSQVKLRDGTGGVDEKISDVHVGSPRYIRETCFQDAACGRDLDPAVRRLLVADEVDVEVEFTEAEATLERHLSKGESAIVVAVDGQVVGCLFAADTVRPAASAAVAALAQRGLSVRVASGDRREAVWSAAAAAGVPKSYTSWAATPGELEPDSWLLLTVRCVCCVMRASYF